MPYVTGSNVSGFMPDEEPSASATWEEARAAVVEDIKRDAEAEAESRPDETSEDGVHPIDAVRDAVLAEIDLATPEQPFNARFNGRVYFLDHAPADLNVFTYQMTDGETEIFWALDPSATPLVLVPFQGDRTDPAALARHKRLVETLCAAMKADNAT
ncbi:hypothetical protein PAPPERLAPAPP_01600 [Brevundimonas phage vB_BpoS-Papperlapapp]|nr:hypothetical protein PAPPERLAPAPP_01600 [Brevundimonas phage vB_BpoS-Papperlapapp]